MNVKNHRPSIGRCWRKRKGDMASDLFKTIGFENTVLSIESSIFTIRDRSLLKVWQRYRGADRSIGDALSLTPLIMAFFVRALLRAK
jgi:hypothetical protein